MTHRSPLLLVGVTLAALLPFLGKAVHIDDTLFVMAARHIAAHPFDFYGFSVNWYGWDMPFYEVTQNPPLFSYYLALAGRLLGWSETALHAACLAPAALAVLGTAALARQLGRDQLTAGLVALACPLFLVSASTLMCDVTMLAFWVWAAVFWLRGLEGRRPLLLGVSAALMCGALLTKYFGVCLVPLLAAYTVLRDRRDAALALYALPPLGALAAYQWLTGSLYGHELFSNAVGYSQAANTLTLGKFLVTACFLGGGALSAAAASAGWLNRRHALALAVVCLAAFLHISSAGKLHWHSFVFPQGFRGELMVQAALYIAFAAAMFLACHLAARDLPRAERAFLFLWIFGVFAFTAFVNWTVNGRSLLPLVPALGLALAGPPRPASWKRLAPLLPCLALSLAVVYGDARLAGADKDAAATLDAMFPSKQNVKYQGHWGFQHYMRQYGFEQYDSRAHNLKPGDYLITPVNNVGAMLDSAGRYPVASVVETPVARWICTQHAQAGAGFYSEAFGPLPFALTRIPPISHLVSVLPGK